MIARTLALDLRRDPADELRGALERLLEPGGVSAVVQPIVRTRDHVVVAYEALARMTRCAPRPPDWWLCRAGEFNARTSLEVACLAAAARLGEPPGRVLLFVNASPSTLTEPKALEMLDRLPTSLVIELTEQESVDDYAQLKRDLAPWRERGVRLAIDDVGSGYSSLRHVVELAPDFMKIDRELIHGIPGDARRAALVRAIVGLGADIGTEVIAEGVESACELDCLVGLGVMLVQGDYLARPGPPWPHVH